MLSGGHLGPGSDPTGFHGQDFVIHLAATSSLEYTWEDILYPNVIGTYNVFEAARQAQVKRVVFASSGSITTGWEREEPYKAIVQGRYEDVPPAWPMITHETLPRPFGLYGCSKLWGEGLARHLSDTSDLSIICIRIGEVVEEDRPTNNRRFSMWCSHRDLLQIVVRCLQAPDTLRFDIFYAVSDNKWNYRDISHAKDVLGHEPEDQAESYR
ncbi:MAG: NAD(P)-dependent oxidoreductase [Gammaproteobacteria bacterium]|nr:NAD(P)-dependent oxidoreductase [Gammaproteobacteria bacterium]